MISEVSKVGLTEMILFVFLVAVLVAVAFLFPQVSVERCFAANWARSLKGMCCFFILEMISSGLVVRFDFVNTEVTVSGVQTFVRDAFIILLVFLLCFCVSLVFHCFPLSDECRAL